MASPRRAAEPGPLCLLPGFCRSRPWACLPAVPVAAVRAEHRGRMASETGPGDSGPPGEACDGLGPGRALQEAEARGPPGGEQTAGACGAGAERWAVPAVVGGTTEGGVRLRAEDLPECVALAEREEAEAKGEEEIPVWEDIMEVVEVVTEEEENDSDDDNGEDEGEENSQEQAGRSASTSRSPMEALQVLQLELSTVNARASRAFARLKRKLRQRRKPYLERRRAIIQGIPGFWAKAVSFPLPTQQAAA